MNVAPPPLTEARKEAYRHLLYVAMLQIRRHCDFGEVSRNPWVWRRRYADGRVAGAVANWLHNLARFSRDNFESFDEEYFWKEHHRYLEQFPGEELERYRKIFDGYLDGVYHTC